MSGQVRFIGCTHFGHENMAKKRGFSSSEQHDELIISNWNKTVDKGDVTYLCGDLFMESKKYFHLLNELKGMKKVILGNHCMMNNVPELLKYVNGVAGMMKYKSKEYGSFWLTHCPVHPTELDYRVGMNIHAHVHENSIPDKRYINVCCENVDYTPRTLGELMATIGGVPSKKLKGYTESKIINTWYREDTDVLFTLTSEGFTSRVGSKQDLAAQGLL